MLSVKNEEILNLYDNLIDEIWLMYNDRESCCSKKTKNLIDEKREIKEKLLDENISEEEKNKLNNELKKINEKIIFDIVSKDHSLNKYFNIIKNSSFELFDLNIYRELFNNVFNSQKTIIDKFKVLVQINYNIYLVKKMIKKYYQHKYEYDTAKIPEIVLDKVYLIGEGGENIVFKARYEKKLQNVKGRKVYSNLVVRLNRKNKNIHRILKINELLKNSKYLAKIKTHISLDDHSIIDCLRYYNGKDASSYRFKDICPTPQNIIQMLLGLKELNDANIIHFDIKTSNILVRETENGNIFNICDFGLAQIKDYYFNISTGTITTLSPEVLNFFGDVLFNFEKNKPLKEIFEKTDVWSLGASIFDMFYKNHLLDALNILDQDKLQKLKTFKEIMNHYYKQFTKSRFILQDEINKKIDQIKIKDQENDFFSEEIKKLLKLMLVIDYEKRKSIDELLKIVQDPKEFPILSMAYQIELNRISQQNQENSSDEEIIELSKEEPKTQLIQDIQNSKNNIQQQLQLFDELNIYNKMREKYYKNVKTLSLININNQKFDINSRHKDTHVNRFLSQRENCGTHNGVFFK